MLPSFFYWIAYLLAFVCESRFLSSPCPSPCFFSFFNNRRNYTGENVNERFFWTKPCIWLFERMYSMWDTITGDRQAVWMPLSSFETTTCLRLYSTHFSLQCETISFLKIQNEMIEEGQKVNRKICLQTSDDDAAFLPVPYFPSPFSHLYRSLTTTLPLQHINTNATRVQNLNSLSLLLCCFFNASCSFSC